MNGEISEQLKDGKSPSKETVRTFIGWFGAQRKLLRVVDAYCVANAAASRDEIYERIERLRGILNNSLGLIELNADLDVETVSEIFVRINSQGVPLNAADFAMSKMAANEKYNGHQLRKCIDYFCHLAIAPEAYGDLARDSEFAGTKYFQAMEWLKHEKGAEPPRSQSYPRQTSTR